MAWGLGNIAGNSPADRDLCIAGGAVTGLVALLTRPDLGLSATRTAVWALCNMARGEPAAPLGSLEVALPLLWSNLAHSVCGHGTVALACL